MLCICLAHKSQLITKKNVVESQEVETIYIYQMSKSEHGNKPLYYNVN